VSGAEFERPVRGADTTEHAMPSATWRRRVNCVVPVPDDRAMARRTSSSSPTPQRLFYWASYDPFLAGDIPKKLMSCHSDAVTVDTFQQYRRAAAV
jgi:hypothetical protein